jgi:hypothetical protein
VGEGGAGVAEEDVHFGGAAPPAHGHLQRRLVLGSNKDRLGVFAGAHRVFLDEAFAASSDGGLEGVDAASADGAVRRGRHHRLVLAAA